MWPWLRNQWNDIKGNVKFALLVFLLGGSGGGIVTWLTALTHGLQRWQQVTIVALFTVLFFCTIAALFWALGARSKAAAAATISEPPPIVPSRALISPPPRLSDIVAPRPAPAKETNLIVEILEVLFRKQGDLFLSGGGNWFVVTNVRVTNRAAVEPTITSWKLRVAVGAQVSEASPAPVPDEWVIERRESSYGSKTTVEAIPRPTLDILAANEEFKRGKPKTGWVAFKLWTSDYRTVAPYNAELTIEVTDSMGNTHSGLWPAQFYVETGSVVYREQQKS